MDCLRRFDNDSSLEHGRNGLDIYIHIAAAYDSKGCSKSLPASVHVSFE